MPMFWDHADADTYLTWLGNEGFEVVWHRLIPEGDAAHTLVLARRRHVPAAELVVELPIPAPKAGG